MNRYFVSLQLEVEADSEEEAEEVAETAASHAADTYGVIDAWASNEPAEKSSWE